MQPIFWKDRRVFVTGHTGFKGGWLTIWLKQLDARVTGYSLETPTWPSLFAQADVSRGVESLHGDILDLPHLCRAFKQSQPEVVLHLAAQPLVRRSYDQPVETLAVNVLGTAHVLEAARQTASVRAVVIVTTDKCYENCELTRGYIETDRLGGHDPYSASKACAELVTAAYRRSFFRSEKDQPVGVATARAGNVIGGGDWAADRILPDAVRALECRQPLDVRQPHAVRPWQHVLEPVVGYLQLAEQLYHKPGQRGEAWNFGPAAEDCVPVAELLDEFYGCWGRGEWRAHGPARALHETRCLRLDAAKANRELGWLPQLPLSEAVAWTVEWYQAALSAEVDLPRLTRQQIHAYQRLVQTTSAAARAA